MSKVLTLGTCNLQVAPSAEGARNYSQCDSMLIGDGAAANTYPYIQVPFVLAIHFESNHMLVANAYHGQFYV